MTVETVSNPDAPPLRLGSPSTQATRPGTLRRLGDIYRETLVRQGRGEGFLISLSFVLASLAVRAVTHLIHHQKLAFLFHDMSSGGGTHIHHMVFGILGLLLVGFIGIGYRPDRRWARRALAIGYGVAAALTLDEFALWLRLEDVYWSRQGRESVDALILAGGISLVGVQGFAFWRGLWRDTVWLLLKRGGPYPPL